MNNRDTLIIMVLVIALVLAGLLIIKSLIKIPVEPVPFEETGRIEKEAAVIPENTIPTSQEIEENERAREEKREASQKIEEMITRKKDMRKTIQETPLEEIPEEKAAAVSKEKSSQQPAGPPTRKEVKFPTREEVQEMKARGILTY